MAQQEEGWPLGLRLLNSRIRLVRNCDFSGSVSFSTVLSASTTASTYSSSDLDTESSGTFFHDRSITLASLIRISSFLELSRRSSRERMMDPSKENKKKHKLKPWLFSLCSKLSTDAVCGNDAHSLGHHLEAERRVASTYRRDQCPITHRPNGFSPIQYSNSLFAGRQDGHQSSDSGEDGEQDQQRIGT